MNSIVTQDLGMLHQTQAIRHQLMEILSDADLDYQLPGDNPTLGALCVEIGQTEQSYINSFKIFSQDWSFKPVDDEMASSVGRLKAWYQELEAELNATLSALTEHDIAGRMIDRGFEFQVPVKIQLHIYRESLLIFYAKAAVYLKAMRKELPQQMHEWIG